VSTFERKVRTDVAPVRKTEKVVDAKSIDGGAMYEFAVESKAEYSALLVSVRATYHSEAKTGVRVRWLYSADNVNFDSPEDAEKVGNSEDLTFSAGDTRQRTVIIPLFKPYVKVQVMNLDETYAATITVWKTLLR